MEFIPVWRDTKIKWTLSNSTEDAMTYKVYVTSTGKNIYTGRAYRRPNTDYVEFKLNKIAENYLKQNLEDGTTAMDTFVVYYGPYNYPAGSYTFYYNYDYSTVSVKDDCVLLSNSINDKVAENGKLVCTFLNAKDSTHTVLIEKMVNNVWATHATEYVAKGTISNKVYDVADFGNATKIRVLGKIWDITKCADYQLIYLNKMGGYDVVNLNGRLGKVDNIQSKTFTKSYDNTTSDWSENKYINTVRTEYEGHIYFLNNKQAEKLDNLYGSTEVYLYDKKNDKMTPVIIKDNSLDYQSYKKLCVFKIKFIESQSRIR